MDAKLAAELLVVEQEDEERRVVAAAIKAEEDGRHNAMLTKFGGSKLALKESESGTVRKKKMQNTHPMLRDNLDVF